MGLLINGVWQEQEPAPAKDGHFERRDSAFRNWITPDGRPGPTGQDGFTEQAYDQRTQAKAVAEAVSHRAGGDGAFGRARSQRI